MSKEHITLLKDWAVGWRDDIEALKRAVASDGGHQDLRRYAAAALSYLVTRMDLVPDWEPTIGLFDDVMVLRICASQAQRAAGSEDGLDHRTQVELARLANQAERIDAFLGADLAGKLRAHCDGLLTTEVRGRTPAAIVADEKARAQLFAEVDDALKAAPPVTVTDPDQATVRLKAYLGHKLK